MKAIKKRYQHKLPGKTNRELIVSAIGIEQIDEAMKFQAEIINIIGKKDLFTPLTKEEFLKPIVGLDNVYFLKDCNEIAGMFVATCDEPELLEGYELHTQNVILIDSIMVAKKYRGKGLQRQILDFLKERGLILKKDGLVATVHPDNFYSLRNFLKCGYDIINTIPNIHGGERNIVFYELDK